MENWSKSIETDMKTISSALEYAYKGLLPTENSYNVVAKF